VAVLPMGLAAARADLRRCRRRVDRDPLIKEEEMATTCPGCVGRGTGTQCFICGGTVPTSQRRTPQSPSEIRSGCRDCAAGRKHTHR
jgi:hypothetical protein